MEAGDNRKDELLLLYESHVGKVSDKWRSYLAVYENLLRPYREKPVRILEIGIQNGGSLEIWSKYFPGADVIVGCDIDPLCADLKYDEKNIHVVVGDANTVDIQREITEISDHFDVIIDDGSHVSRDIIRSFGRYYPLVAPGGLFVAEDLHCSYWNRFQGGLQAPFSSIAFFKRLCDIVNFEHWGASVSAESALDFFSERYEQPFNSEDLLTIQRVSFMNSICAIHKCPNDVNKLGHRIIAGKVADVCADPLEFKNHDINCPDETKLPWGPNQESSEYMVSKFPEVSKELHDRIVELRNLNEELLARRVEAQDFRGEIARISHALQDSQALVSEAQALLSHTRGNPFCTMRNYTLHKVFDALARCTALLPTTTADRFRSIADEHDPRKPIR